MVMQMEFIKCIMITWNRWCQSYEYKALPWTLPNHWLLTHCWSGKPPMEGQILYWSQQSNINFVLQGPINQTEHSCLKINFYCILSAKRVWNIWCLCLCNARQIHISNKSHSTRSKILEQMQGAAHWNQLSIAHVLHIQGGGQNALSWRESTLYRLL